MEDWVCQEWRAGSERMRNWRRRTLLCGLADHLVPMFPGVRENAMGVSSDFVRAGG